jgi:hypothetical protein
MKPIALFACAALSAATLALAQTTDQPVPQPQPGPKTQSSETPPPPSPSDPSMTTMQQPISGNSGATNPHNSMAPNAAEPGSRLASVLPSGMTMKEACQSFKTTNECAAALHASHDLNIPFEQLREKMSGGQSLGTAIHALKPDADTNTAVRKAEQEAHMDLKAPQG